MATTGNDVNDLRLGPWTVDVGLVSNPPATKRALFGMCGRRIDCRLRPKTPLS